MNKELTKRLITSFFLLFILAFSYINKYCLALTLIALSILTFIEFKNIIDKIFNLCLPFNECMYFRNIIFFANLFIA